MNIDYKKIKMLISDVDGVWTDGSFYKGPDSFELKKFSVFDGIGMLIHQAAHSFNIWFKVFPETKSVLEDLESMRE